MNRIFQLRHFNNEKNPPVHKDPLDQSLDNLRSVYGHVISNNGRTQVIKVLIASKIAQKLVRILPVHFAFTVMIIASPIYLYRRAKMELTKTLSASAIFFNRATSLAAKISLSRCMPPGIAAIFCAIWFCFCWFF